MNRKLQRLTDLFAVQRTMLEELRINHEALFQELEMLHREGGLDQAADVNGKVSVHSTTLRPAPVPLQPPRRHLTKSEHAPKETTSPHVENNTSPTRNGYHRPSENGIDAAAGQRPRGWKAVTNGERGNGQELRRKRSEDAESEKSQQQDVALDTEDAIDLRLRAKKQQRAKSHDPNLSRAGYGNLKPPAKPLILYSLEQLNAMTLDRLLCRHTDLITALGLREPHTPRGEMLVERVWELQKQYTSYYGTSGTSTVEDTALSNVPFGKISSASSQPGRPPPVMFTYDQLEQMPKEIIISRGRDLRDFMGRNDRIPAATQQAIAKVLELQAIYTGNTIEDFGMPVPGERYVRSCTPTLSRRGLPNQ